MQRGDSCYFNGLRRSHGQLCYTCGCMKTPPKIAVFPGTFDPMTNGHLDVIRRGRQLFDQLIVAIGRNPGKEELFSIEEREEMIRQIVGDCCSNVIVDTFEGLTVDYARKMGANVILRGLRNVTDLHYEFQLALTNRAVADIETVFIMTGETYGFTSSSLIKQIASAGEIDRMHRLLPAIVLEKLKEKKALSGGKLLRRHRPDEFRE